MKKLLLTLLLVMGLCIFTGCNVTLDYTIKDDGTYTSVEGLWMSFDDFKSICTIFADDMDPSEKAMIESIKTDEDFATYLTMYATSQGQAIETKEINGTMYYSMGGDTFDGLQGVDESGNVIKSNAFKLEFDAKEQADELISGFASMIDEDQAQVTELFTVLMGSTGYTLNVTFPEKIVLTNGTLSKDKKTVTFQFTLADEKINMYAYTADGIISLSTGDAAYTRKSKVNVVTDDKVKSITVNGTTQKSKKITLKDEGKYDIVVTTKNAEKSFTIVKDSTKPVVTGVENGKTYKGSATISFSDDGSGVKSAKLNGKKVKSGKKITKKGNYTLKVTDKAGNKTTIKFTIE